MEDRKIPPVNSGLACLISVVVSYHGATPATDDDANDNSNGNGMATTFLTQVDTVVPSAGGPA